MSPKGDGMMAEQRRPQLSDFDFQDATVIAEKGDERMVGPLIAHSCSQAGFTFTFRDEAGTTSETALSLSEWEWRLACNVVIFTPREALARTSPARACMFVLKDAPATEDRHA
ncbi:MAG TPA: hypothetical protein QF873_01525 [Patescibacteria group bacterium]|nr:hypothetical protein [Patescibacteria group bacterium]